MESSDRPVRLELRAWIKDTQQGVVNIKSDIQVKIWDSFKANGIEFRFPQQDLHLKSPQEITVRVKERVEDQGDTESCDCRKYSRDELC
jgi:small-conductance mechanosensitive channel